MKILIISSYLPYPLYSGGHIRLYNLMKELSKNHEITLVCEKRKNQTKEDEEMIEKICKQVYSFERLPQWSFSNIVKTGFSKNPFLVVGHRNQKMRNRIADLLSKNSYDLIHAETFYIMQNIPKTSLPIVLAEHNIEYMVYKRFADHAPFFLRPFLFIDIAKLKYAERNFWKKATRVIAVSEVEQSYMKNIPSSLVPNGVDINKFKIQNAKFKIDNKEKKILFIGDFKWIQNRESVEWILKDIWPKINLKLKTDNTKLTLQLWIVGRNIPEKIKKLTNDPSVIFDESAPSNTEDIFQKADILLSPIRVGGGTSYKILEAMASGVPVVTTKLGIQGLTVKAGEDIVVSETTEELSQNLVSLLTDEKMYEKISKNARKVIEEKYNWKIIAKQLEEVYRSVV